MKNYFDLQKKKSYEFTRKKKKKKTERNNGDVTTTHVIFSVGLLSAIIFRPDNHY